MSYSVNKDRAAVRWLRIMAAVPLLLLMASFPAKASETGGLGLPAGWEQEFDGAGYPEDWETGTVEPGGLDEEAAAMDAMNQLQFGKVIESPPMKMKFQEETEQFQYYFPDGQFFESNTPNGGITGGTVAFSFPESMSAIVRRNGKAVEGSVFSQAGAYVMTVNVSPTFKENGGGNDTYILRFYFQIIPPAVNDMEIFNAPAGFSIREVTCDGIKKDVELSEAYRMGRDGSYRFLLVSPEAGVSYVTEIVKDSTPPLLDIELTKGRGKTVREAVCRPREKGIKITIRRNGEPWPEDFTKLTGRGVYKIRAEDQAGNSREYTVRITAGESVPVGKVIIISVLVAAAVIGFMIYARCHMPVL